ncbi:periplasmic heavy metal sensor [Yoonia sp. GPGPB17]|uniref:periplasmic heavy metal sensor n=1 Tax=Yoonia sp. GPGPB17 TaxID=3026147 RepID=UPI0030BAA88A
MAKDKLPTARPGRLWRIVLVLSLALNLAVVGIVAGAIASGRVGDGPPRSFDLGVGPIARALEPDERRAVGRSLRQDRSLRSLDFRGRVNDMVTTLRAEPFDADALRALMTEQAAGLSDIQAKAQEATLAQIIAMTPERRRAFADQVADELSRDKPQRRHNSGG